MWTPVNIIALVAAAGAILTPITALILNYSGFTTINRRLEVLEGDYKNFYKEQSNQSNDIHNLQTDVKRLKEKSGMD